MQRGSHSSLSQVCFHAPRILRELRDDAATMQEECVTAPYRPSLHCGRAQSRSRCCAWIHHVCIGVSAFFASFSAISAPFGLKVCGKDIEYTINMWKKAGLVLYHLGVRHHPAWAQPPSSLSSPSASSCKFVESLKNALRRATKCGTPMEHGVSR